MIKLHVDEKWLRIIFMVLIVWLWMSQFRCNTFWIKVIGLEICPLFHETNYYAHVLATMRRGHGSNAIFYQKILAKAGAGQSGRFGLKTSIQHGLWVINVCLISTIFGFRLNV